MATTTVGSVMTATFSDASKLDFKLAYQPFFITGDLVPDGNGGKTLAGGLLRHLQPAHHRCDGGRQGASVLL